MKTLLLTLGIGMMGVLSIQGARAFDTGSPTVRTAQNQEETAPDNSGRNMRDRDDATVTPMNQGASEADRTITQEIRKAVMSHDGLSMDAKNIKIVTQGGIVTLRGPVKNVEEKATIAAVSKATPGVKRVDNQLEVEALR